MIDRYETAEMSAIWSEENRFAVMLQVELAACRAWSERGEIPAEALEDILSRATFSVSRIQEIESAVHHDVIAFVSSVAENVGENGRYIHMGLTSSDVLDTASSILLRESLLAVRKAACDLDAAVVEKARQYRHLPCVGRTHGIHAEPMTLGLKFLNWHAELERDLARVDFAISQIAFGKISGAVGTYALCPPEIEARVCELLNLTPAPVSNQILQRDRHAGVMNAIALLGCGLERMATEVRHLQRTEAGELYEPFGSAQKGSSAMPHKRNPIKSERVCGMARLLRGYAVASMENVALWHERDISHSSTERVIWPDAFHAVHFMLADMTGIVRGLVVDEERIRRNLELTGGLIYSQRVMLALIDELKVPRETAYKIVQENAMRTARGEGKFFDLLREDERLSGVIDAADLSSLFDVDFYTRYVDRIFERFHLL
ncbi:MAG: adenylosuccinate lyase [Synergistaceae bacterium]|jgi:adenylosuccinate lyase|nr:adenylosuccinate lyase [Synergistaceae bacterium]